MARETLLDFFADFAHFPSTFLVFDDGYRTHRYTYRQVANAANHFAELLNAAGIHAGDKVVFWSENRPEWIAAFWGCLLAGVVVVPVDYRASEDLLRRIAALVDARVILTGSEIPAHRAQLARSPTWPLADFDWTPVATATLAPVPPRPDSLCEIIFTSGATAEPKGVTITHANLLANIVPVENEIRKHRKWSRPFAPIRFLNLLPLSHLFGQSMATFIPPVLPGEVVFMSGYNPRDIVHQIHSRRISVLVSVPKILEILRGFVLQNIPEAAEPPPEGADWVRRWWHYRRVHNLFGWKFWSFIVGAAPLDPALEEFWSKLGFLVVQGYGLTETAPIITLNHPFHTSKGSVGKPIGGVEIKIAPDGEILVRGPNVTSGYFEAQPSEDYSFNDGWFHTGDIGSVDSENRVFVRGRKKEMIVLQDGLNVFPEDVENVLNQSPGVRESAVIGKDRVHAVLVVEEGEDIGSIVEQANRKLESHQQIREASLWPSGPLPRTEGTQKLRRVAIREWALDKVSAPPAQSAQPEELLADYSDETPLGLLGLSSLDRVEVMMRAEKTGLANLTDSAFGQAQTVGELRRLARAAVPEAKEPIRFPGWNRSALAQALRRVALPLFLLPLLRIFVWLRIQRCTTPAHQAQSCTTLHNLNGPVLFAVNHQSILDVPTVLAALPARSRYRTASAMGAEWFRPRLHPEQFSLWKRFGNNLQYYLVCLFFNAFPIAQHEAGARDTLRYMGELVSDNWCVLLFPEGVRTSAGEINRFRPGVGMIGSRLHLPVVPVRIEGLDRVLHQSWHWPRPGRVRVTFGPALTLIGDDYAALAAEVEAAVRALEFPSSSAPSA